MATSPSNGASRHFHFSYSEDDKGELLSCTQAVTTASDKPELSNVKSSHRMFQQGSEWFHAWSVGADRAEWLCVLDTENYRKKIQAGVAAWVKEGGEEADQEKVPPLIREGRKIIELKEQGKKVWIFNPEKHQPETLTVSLMQDVPSIGDFAGWKEFVSNVKSSGGGALGYVSRESQQEGHSSTCGRSAPTTKNGFQVMANGFEFTDGAYDGQTTLTTDTAVGRYIFTVDIHATISARGTKVASTVKITPPRTLCVDFGCPKEEKENHDAWTIDPKTETVDLEEMKIYKKLYKWQDWFNKGNARVKLTNCKIISRWAFELDVEFEWQGRPEKPLTNKLEMSTETDGIIAKADVPTQPPFKLGCGIFEGEIVLSSPTQWGVYDFKGEIMIEIKAGDKATWNIKLVPPGSKFAGFGSFGPPKQFTEKDEDISYQSDGKSVRWDTKGSNMVQKLSQYQDYFGLGDARFKVTNMLVLAPGKFTMRLLFEWNEKDSVKLSKVAEMILSTK